MFAEETKEGMKLLVGFEPNENNMALMSRRHRTENPMGWDSGIFTNIDLTNRGTDLSRFTGIQVTILTDDTWTVINEGLIHIVLTVGTTGAAPFL